MLRAIIVPAGQIQHPHNFTVSVVFLGLLLQVHLVLHLQGLCFQILVLEQLTFRPQHLTHIQSHLIQPQAGVLLR